MRDSSICDTRFLSMMISAFHFSIDILLSRNLLSIDVYVTRNSLPLVVLELYTGVQYYFTAHFRAVLVAAIFNTNIAIHYEL
jgi:hypothetical protein